jgi:PIN domain nuclease of toxin-antitoxin system
MGRYLLDTHAFIWLVMGDRRLSAEIIELVESFTNDIYVSAANIWEISIKQGTGKLPPLSRDAEEVIDETGLIRLDISTRHAQLAGRLPLHHRDPFDRMLVAQAQIEDLIIITNDGDIPKYGVTTLRP